MNPGMTGTPARQFDRAGESDLPALMIGYQQGDPDAVDELVHRISPSLGRYFATANTSGADAEDLLQELGLEIHRKIMTFRGGSEREFLMWVRRMIGSIMANQVRHYLGTKCRDLRLERALLDDVDRSSRALNHNLVAPQSTPSQQAVRREQAVILADALEKLPEDYREVIILRQLEGLSFPEVAARMGRTEDSVKNVWLRALARLRRTLEEPG